MTSLGCVWNASCSVVSQTATLCSHQQLGRRTSTTWIKGPSSLWPPSCSVRALPPRCSLQVCASTGRAVCAWSLRPTRVTWSLCLWSCPVREQTRSSAATTQAGASRHASNGCVLACDSRGRRADHTCTPSHACTSSNPTPTPAHAAHASQVAGAPHVRRGVGTRHLFAQGEGVWRCGPRFAGDRAIQPVTVVPGPPCDSSGKPRAATRVAAAAAPPHATGPRQRRQLWCAGWSASVCWRQAADGACRKCPPPSTRRQR